MGRPCVRRTDSPKIMGGPPFLFKSFGNERRIAYYFGGFPHKFWFAGVGMATTTLEARCNARPTRLAFVLPAPDREMLLTVIARATSLWGGLFNPIVILDDATRIARGRQTFPPERTYIESQADMLMAFDPDILINYGATPLPQAMQKFQHRTFPSANLDWNPWGQGQNTQSYFVDVWPILDELWDKEFKGIATPRVKLKYLEKARSEASPLLAARFGLYSGDGSYEFLAQNFNAEVLDYENWLPTAHWPADFNPPLGLTALHCRPTRQRLHSHAFFLLNPNDILDVVDYWNLRASGMYLLPLTMEDYVRCEPVIRDFAAAGTYPINETVTNHVVLIKAPSITDEEQEAVANWMAANGLAPGVGIVGWVPRYRMNFYGVGNELDIEPLRGFESNAVGVLENGHGKLQGPKPNFLTNQHHFQHWSVDLSPFTFGNDQACYDLPWLNPGCDALVARRIGSHFEIDASRVSRTGIVTRQDGIDGDVYIHPITGPDAIQGFLEGKGIEYVGSSSPGLALTRIVEMLGGLWNCSIFQNSAIRSLLDELAGGNNRVAREVLGAIKKSLKDYSHFGQPATREQIASKAERLLDQAVSAKVFRIGLEFQCSRCKRHNWYAVTEFDEYFNCKSCFARETTPRLDQTSWHYASDGLFRTANKLDGNLTVLLALNFLRETFDRHLWYAPSFDYKIDGEQHEMDFGAFSSRMFNREIETLFGESKSGTALKPEERAKLRTFAEKTGSYLCFCTLAEDFDETDKAYFRELAEAGLKIIFLTRFHLEMDHFAASRYRHDNHAGRGHSMPEWLMRVTIIRTLGVDFARTRKIWI
jgi:hypothetical protein